MYAVTSQRPHEHRHFHQRHARRAHVDDRRDDVDGADDRRHPQDVDREDGHVHARAHLHRQRRVEGPTRTGGAARHEERADQQDRGRRQQPEAEIVQARERHVRRPDHQRDLPVRKAHERRHERSEQHDQAVQRGELVEELRLHDLQPRLEQLGSYDQRHDAADDEHREAEEQIQRADVLVVRRGEPAKNARGLVPVPGVIGD